MGIGAEAPIGTVITGDIQFNFIENLITTT